MDLDCAPSALERLRGTLSSEETHRADRFRDEKMRKRWIAAHGALRSILGEYTHEKPESLRFIVGAHGKPELANSSLCVSFNLSHSQNLGAVVVSPSGRVGVDIEHFDPFLDFVDMIRRLFSNREQEQIQALPEENRRKAFFTAWTRKEAVAKALGSGLSIPMNQIEVSVEPDAPARLVVLAEDDPAQWTLVDIGQAAVAGTIAVELETAALHAFAFQEPTA